MRSQRYRGVVLIWVLFVFFVLFAFTALAVDTGYISLTARQLQVAADSSALAGAQYIRLNEDDARSAAVNFASVNKAAGESIGLDYNGANAFDGDVVVGVWDPEFRIFTA